MNPADRTSAAGFLLCPSILAFFFGLVVSASGMVPRDLRCDGVNNPLGATAVPRLSWRVETVERGQSQSAFQILVASRAELLARNEGDLWDSGRTPAARSPFVAYAGKALSAGVVCHWKVRCWSANGQVSAWSDPAFWEVAPTLPSDWQGARWIDDGRRMPVRDEDFYQPDPAPLLRREFEISQPVVRARLHVAGLGYCLPSLNGKRLDDAVLDPPWTAFDRRILFRTHDVTRQLVEGQNCLGLALGNGWFNPLPLRMWGHRNIRDSLACGRPRAMALLVVEHPDGIRTLVTTGNGWTTTGGPTLKNSIYLGEERDARRALTGWDRAGFDAAAWQPVRVVEAPLAPLKPLLNMPPVRAGDPFPAIAVTAPTSGVYIVDFGRNFTGVPELELDVPEGTRITLRYGELLAADGTLNPLTSVCGQIKGTRKGPDGQETSVGGPGAPPIAWQQDVYIARGHGRETYRPDFTFHGFRYLEITGLPAQPALTALRGIPLGSAIPDAGSFSCSNEQLNRIQQMCRRTFRSNIVGVQSDCPHRERFAYGGDIVATSEAFLMNFDMAGFYAKTVRDWADAARPDGRFTDTAPFVGIDYCGVGWAMVHPLLLEQLHTHYGDRDLVQEQLPAALRWLEVESGRRTGGLVTKGLGDHEALTKAGGPVLTTPMFVDAARRVSRLARLVGRNEEAARGQAMADEAAVAWAERFLNATTGQVGGGSQSEQVFALGFGVVPSAAGEVAFHRLVEAIEAAADGPSLTTGIFGTQLLLEQLARHGRNDLAWALASRDAFPSWGWMLENGATTLWEHWAGSDGTFSHNHPMFGSVSAWLFRWLGGIQPADDAVGFDRIVIRPQLVSGLEWVKCSHHTVRGRVESNWSVTGEDKEFEVVIPPDATATVVLPGGRNDGVRESGRPVAQSPGVIRVRTDGDNVVVEIGSGRYLFEMTQ